MKAGEKWGGRLPLGYSEGSEQRMEDGGRQDSTKLWEKKRTVGASEVDHVRGERRRIG